VVVGYLAERGARHITLLSRREVPPRSEWPQLDPAHSHFATVRAIERAEGLGADVVCVAVDVTDADGVRAWLTEHARLGHRPIRGVIHTAGTVDDRLLLNMTDEDFTKVLAPKVAGTRILHDALAGHPLEFFVMFGSAGSVVASPGQGNYAAANAFLDAFAHYRRARGLPALSIGWGPWSVGMVADLGLERIYAQRGIDLITPTAGMRILDRLIDQRAAAVVAIGADWGRAQQVGLAGQLPPMFADLETNAGPGDGIESAGSILDMISATAESERLDVIAEHVRTTVATIFDCAVSDIAPDELLDDIGLDSLMAMEFRVRVNAMFAIDIPVLEILRGVSVNSLAGRILSELHVADADAPAEPAETDDLEQLIAQLSDVELRELLDELDGS
jgi:acyl carrier protein